MLPLSPLLSKAGLFRILGWIIGFSFSNEAICFLEPSSWVTWFSQVLINQLHRHCMVLSLNWCYWDCGTQEFLEPMLTWSGLLTQSRGRVERNPGGLWFLCPLVQKSSWLLAFAVAWLVKLFSKFLSAKS